MKWAFVEGQNMMWEHRWAEGHYERLPALAADLVSRKVELILAAGGPRRTGGQERDLNDPDRFHRRRRPNRVRPNRQSRPAGRQPHRFQQPRRRARACGVTAFARARSSSPWFRCPNCFSCLTMTRRRLSHRDQPGALPGPAERPPDRQLFELCSSLASVWPRTAAGVHNCS